MGGMRSISISLGVFSLLVFGCRSQVIERADRGVYRLIEERQNDTLATSSDVHLGTEDGDVVPGGRAYGFVPRPTEPGLPEAFQPRRGGEPAAGADRQPASTAEDPLTGANLREGMPAPGTEMSPSIFSPPEKPEVTVLGLRDALAYAMHQGRDLQDAKEDLYVAALELTLERHLWTPQFVASLQADAEFKDPGGLNDYERAVTAVGQVGLTQQLPYGGQLTAQLITTLVRDLENHVTSGETGSVILGAEIPLLRGAGRVAYESRYAAERELIYAVRTFERFRRSYLVNVASRYFDLQQAKARITNAFKSYERRKQDAEEADAKKKAGRATILDTARAQSSFRNAESTLISAKEQYETALDRFKIFVGMPVDTLLDVVGQEEDEESRALDGLLPDIDVPTAIATAMRGRLDLLNAADQVDDSRRGVAIAQNRILPDLDFSAGVTLDSDPDRLNSLSINTERSTYRAGLAFKIDDRKTERNSYRAALISLRRAQRDYEEAVDTVRADVRRALRRTRQQKNLRMIQALNVEENIKRYEVASLKFEKGQLSNQDVVDAEEDLLRARNDFASAVASYRIAILEFRLDSGTLRVNDDGRLDDLTAYLPVDRDPG